jgi:hypothetical protein
VQQETISRPNHTTSSSTGGVTSEGEADIHRFIIDYELKVNLNHYTCMDINHKRNSSCVNPLPYSRYQDIIMINLVVIVLF